MSEPAVRTQDAFVPLTKARFRERFLDLRDPREK